MKKLLYIFIAFMTFFHFCSVNAGNDIQIDQKIKNNEVIITMKVLFDNPVLALRFKIDSEDYIEKNITVKALNKFTLTKAKYYVLDTLEPNKGNVKILEFKIPYKKIKDDDLLFKLTELSYSDGNKTYKLNDYDILIKGFEEKKLNNEITEIEVERPNLIVNPKTGEVMPLLFLGVLIILIIVIIYKNKKIKKLFKI